MANTLTPTHPFTRQPGICYQVDSHEDTVHKIALARHAFCSWKEIALAERITGVRAALGYFRENATTISEELTSQMGRPLKHSHGEITGFLERANYLCDAAEKVLAPVPADPKIDGFERHIEHVPLGVVLTIAAWNYPYLIAVNSVVTAILAGNTVILKHASMTPSVGHHIAKAFGSLKGIDHVVQNVIIDHATTGRVIEQGDINHVVFTGSVSGGHKIQAHTSKRFIACNLELGGKDAVYIAADADPDRAAQAIVEGAMYNAGQSCCGTERVYVHASVYDAIVKRVPPLVEAYKLGDPMDENTTMGPLASPGAASEMAAQIEDATKNGATIVCGGKIKKIDNATFFEPTVLTNVDHKMAVMCEENFGPILPIMKVADDNEAIRLVNDSAYGLTAAIFTADPDRARYFANHADVGTVFMNRNDYLDPALPWTGVKDSGMGSTLSPWGFYGLTRRKSIHFRLS